MAASRIEQAFVHVDVDDLRAVLDLIARDGERCGVVAGRDQLAELRRAGDVGALADIHEWNVGVSVNGSSPDSRSRGSICGMARGALPATARAMARICAGVVPQHPPTMLTRPAVGEFPDQCAP